MQEQLRDLVEADPDLREEALRQLAHLQVDATGAQVVMDALVCRALIDADTEVASLAVSFVAGRLAHRTAPPGFAALRPFTAWLGPQVTAAMHLESRSGDPAVLQRLVSNLCLAAIREVGPTRLNALSVLRRLVLDGHLSDALVDHAARMLDLRAKLGADGPVVEVLLACAERVPLDDLDPGPYRRLDSEGARLLVQRLDPSVPRPPLMRVPVGWDDIPVELRPWSALSNPPMCSECRHVHVSTPVLCERCGYWVFVAPDTHIPANPGPRPEPPEWVQWLRRAQAGPALIRVPRGSLG